MIREITNQEKRLMEMALDELESFAKWGEWTNQEASGHACIVARRYLDADWLRFDLQKYAVARNSKKCEMR